MFDLHTSILDSEYGEELDEGRLDEYIHELMVEFEESAEAEVLMAGFDTSLCWPATYMHYAAQYFCATPVSEPRCPPRLPLVRRFSHRHPAGLHRPTSLSNSRLARQARLGDLAFPQR